MVASAEYLIIIQLSNYTDLHRCN